MKIKVLLFLFAASLQLNAQWVEDTEVNTLVADANTLDLIATNNSVGETFIVYWINIGAPLNLELRLQKLDVDGNRVFGDEGLLVSNEIPMSTYVTQTSVAMDDQDNLYIGVTATGNSQGYLFKIDSDGNLLWGSAGVNVGPGFALKLLPMSNGDLLAAWLGGDATIQRFDGDGNAVWADSVVVTAAVNTAPADLFELSNGDFVLTFHTYNFGVDSKLNAQRFDAMGNPVWNNHVEFTNLGSAWNRRYSTVQDGDTIYYGYGLAEGLRYDAFLQRINPDGSLPYGLNGTDFSTMQNEYEISMDIAHDPGSNEIWGICIYTDNTQSLVGEYVQKFNKVTGERLLGEHAHEIYPASNMIDDVKHNGSLTLVNGTPFFVVEVGSDNGATPTTLNVMQLDENGDFAWTNEYEPVATYTGNKSRTHLTNRVNGQNVIVFVEDRGDGERIYAQNFIDMNSSVAETFIESGEFSFQNPVRDQLVVNSNYLMTDVVIYDLAGRPVWMQENMQVKELSLNVGHLTSGMYLMTIMTEEGQSRGLKIVVE